MRSLAVVEAPQVSEAEIIDKYDRASGREERAGKAIEVATLTAKEAREEKGRLLVLARNTLFRGRGDGFVQWVQTKLREDVRTAQNYMRLVGAIDEKVSLNELPPKTYAEAGIVKREKKPRQQLPPSVEIEESDEEYIDEADSFGTDASDQKSYLAAYLLRADQAVRFAIYRGQASREVIARARLAAEAWTKLANEIEGKL